jgi:hypothetical protein
MAVIFHKIKAWLYRNVLTKDNPNDYIARVAAERTVNTQEICESAVVRGGADISADAMEHAATLFQKEMAYLLCDGFSVNTGYFTATVLIKEPFDSPSEKFDPKKHYLLFDFHQGALLRKELEFVEVEILGVADTNLHVLQVVDVKTGSINDLLTPDRNLRIAGSKIKIAGTDESVGVYFVNQDTAEKTKVDPSEVVTNNPSELIIVIPELVSGTYKLEVTSQFAHTAILKEPRTTVFDRMLTVL